MTSSRRRSQIWRTAGARRTTSMAPMRSARAWDTEACCVFTTVPSVNTQHASVSQALAERIGAIDVVRLGPAVGQVCERLLLDCIGLGVAPRPPRSGLAP